MEPPGVRAGRPEAVFYPDRERTQRVGFGRAGPYAARVAEAEAERVGFLRAAAAPWQGLYFLIRTPRAWPLAIVPVLVGTVLIAILASLSIGVLAPKVGELIGPTKSWWGEVGRIAAQVLAAMFGILLGLMSAALLSQPLSAPALERLVRLRERELGLPARRPTSLLVDMWRSARGALIGLVGITLVVLLTSIDFLVPGSTPFVLPIKIAVSGIFVSWDLLDYPLSVRDMRLRDRLAWIGSHKAEVMGFGMSLAAVFLIPCMQLLLLPAGVVGATALVFSIEEAEKRNAQKRDARQLGP